MRPVERGPAPQVFEKYEDAKPFLVQRLGLYCSYCERPIKTLLAVEHVQPKSLHPDLREEWTNFLLGCTNCNSSKGSQPVDRNATLLPDQDNPLTAIEYDQYGRVFPMETVASELQARAATILSLTGLDKFPDEFIEETEYLAALERWQQRSQAWAVAELAFNDLQEVDTEQLRRAIVREATASGFFSVWMTVFASQPDMLRRFIKAFPGTAVNCFDDLGAPVERTA